MESQAENISGLLKGDPVVCAACLVTFWGKKGQLYCSKSCGTRVHQGIPSFKECAECGGHFATDQRHVKCERHRGRPAPPVVWPEPPGVCAYCTGPAEPGREFCSPHCKGASQKLSRLRICAQCGLPWRMKAAASKATHCPECRHVRPLGAPPAEMSSGMRRARRRQLIERDGEGCTCCGATDGLEIHHIEHQEHGGKHALENLKFLCGDCHDGVHGRHGVLSLALAA